MRNQKSPLALSRARESEEEEEENKHTHEQNERTIKVGILIHQITKKI